MNYQRLVFGYHGCTVDRFERALLEGEHPPMSDEPYDWLGKGIYAWEYGPERAESWAKDKCKREKRSPDEARVLGMVIQLGVCFDLLDIKHTRMLRLAYDELKALGVKIPQNRKENKDGDILLRERDCMMINLTAQTSDYDTVRGAFWEGGPAFEGAEVQAMSHIQIAVRNPECIIGYFNPTNTWRMSYDLS